MKLSKADWNSSVNLWLSPHVIIIRYPQPFIPLHYITGHGIFILQSAILVNLNVMKTLRLTHWLVIELINQSSARLKSHSLLIHERGHWYLWALLLSYNNAMIVTYLQWLVSPSPPPPVFDP